MKKKIYALFLTVLMVLSVAACGKKEDSSKDDTALKEEVVKFVNEDLPSISAERDSAVSLYNQYFEEGAGMDSETWLSSLEGTAIVDYEIYLHNLEALVVTTPEVTNLKTLYQQCAQNQYGAMQDVISALKNGDMTLLDSAQEKISISESYMRQYEEALKSLCDQYGITINGSFTMLDMATAGDAGAAEPAVE